ncbi:MAG: DNA replication/repair protein RecF [Clostridia bacterium]|nr:DNA replication/repair protein RecF [Clostridia bacterium]
MIVQSLNISNYRNIEQIEFQPSPSVNVIYGENAQGKTNLLEAIWLFTGLRSFRGSKERELRRFDTEAAKLSMAFHNDVRDMTADILITDKKTASLGGLPYGASTKLVGEFLAVIFAPQHLDLIKGGPAERRKFLNQALCQLKPNYAKALTQFNRAMQQRNQLLKDAIYHSELYDTLDVWDDRFCTFGAYVISERMKYLDELRPFLEEFYGGISGGREKISIEYAAGTGSSSSASSASSKFQTQAAKLAGLEATESGNAEQESFQFSSSDPAVIKQELAVLLKAHRREDAYAGFTTVGPHRDDLVVKLDGLSVKSFGSQGQQRSCALSLKMSEGFVIRALTGKQPVALLDDVMSELDAGRQDYILNHIDGWQVFLTCCEPSSILLSKQSENGKLFEVAAGKLV